MGNFPPNVSFYLQVYLRGASDVIEIKLRERQMNRFRSNTVGNEDNDGLFDFFTCDTIDGKHIAINLKKIQAVNLLEQIYPFVEDSTVFKGPIRLLLDGKKDYIEIPSTTEPSQLYEFFHCLESGRDFAGIFLSFPDDDDEEFIINMDELLYIEAPQSLVDKGWELWKEEMGMED